MLPNNENESKFLQIYFMGNEETEINQRCKIINGMNREIISNLQRFLHKNNAMVSSFKYALEHMPSHECKIIIKADPNITKAHKKRLNAPSTNEIAVLMVHDEINNRDIVIQKRDNTLQRVNETHRKYDALQYPLLFWRGEDGYHFEYKLFDRKTKSDMKKKVIILFCDLNERSFDTFMNFRYQ